MDKRLLRPLLALLGALALGACEQLSDLIEPKPQPASHPPAVSKAPPAKPQAQAKPAPVPAKPATTAAAAVKNPLGLSDTDTRRLFGAPASVSPNPPGQQWLYKAKGCSVSLHLYPDVERGGLYTVDAAGEGGSVEQCLAKVQAAQKPSTTKP